MDISESTLRWKARRYTGLTSKHNIRTIRLNHASEMLENDVGTVSEIAGAVGFSNKSYFAKCFQNQFGILPKDFKIRPNF